MECKRLFNPLNLLFLFKGLSQGFENLQEKQIKSPIVYQKESSLVLYNKKNKVSSSNLVRMGELDRVLDSWVQRGTAAKRQPQSGLLGNYPDNSWHAWQTTRVLP